MKNISNLIAYIEQRPLKPKQNNSSNKVLIMTQSDKVRQKSISFYNK